MATRFLVLPAAILGAAFAFLSIETVGIGLLLVTPFVIILRRRSTFVVAACLTGFAAGFLGAVVYFAQASGVLSGRADMNTSIVYFGHASLGILGLGVALAVWQRSRRASRRNGPTRTRNAQP